MTNWTAGQLAQERDTHSGSTVEFTTQGYQVSGILDLAYPSLNGPWAHLVVDGKTTVVNNDVTVVVR